MTIHLAGIKLYTLEEIQEAFREAGQTLTLLTLRQYAKTGKIKARKMGTRWLVSEEALQEFFNPKDTQGNNA